MFTLRAFGPPRPARAKRLPLFKRRLLDVIRNNKGGGEGGGGNDKEEASAVREWLKGRFSNVYPR